METSMASLNLDRLKREPLSVTLDGVDHVLAPPALALLGKLADLSRIAKDDGAAQRTATLDLLGRIAPSLKAHGALDTLEDAPEIEAIAHGIIAYGLGEAVEACPHEDNLAAYWQAGWRKAAEIAAEEDVEEAVPQPAASSAPQPEAVPELPPEPPPEPPKAAAPKKPKTTPAQPRQPRAKPVKPTKEPAPES